MRTAGLALAAALALAAYGSAQVPAAQVPVVQADFSNPQLNPTHWTLTLHPDGSGHFSSQAGKVQVNDTQDIYAPNIDRAFQLSPEYAQRVFLVAQRHNWFNVPCASHMKIAFQGWKQLSYRGPEGQGSCTFNYSKDKDIQALADSLDAVAQTILEGERLKMLLQHDPLGLDREMEYLTEAAQDGRAQQICVIRSILEQLAQDDGVMNLVRQQARKLLALAGA